MKTIEQAKREIDLISVVEYADVELKRSGTRHIGLCPFHAEKTPSFYVFQDNRFKCFGCGEHGDVIDFVRKLYGLSFQNGLKNLGIEQGKITPEVRRDIAKAKRRKELIKQFRNWEQRKCRHVSNSWREMKKLMLDGIPADDLDFYAPLFHMLPIWEYYRDIFINGNDELKYKLFQEARQCKRQIST